MAVVIPGKLVYLATHHTGSKATQHALKQIPGALTNKMPHHASKDEVQPFTEGGELYVTTVRNPYDLAVTWYLRRKKMAKNRLNLAQEPTFEWFLEHLEQILHPNQLRDGTIFWHDVDGHLRYESLQEDLDALLDSLDLPQVELEQRNVTVGKRPWPSYHTNETLKIMNDRFFDEIIYHGYEILAPIA